MRRLLFTVAFLAGLFFTYQAWVLPKLDFIGGKMSGPLEERAEELNRDLPRFVDRLLELRSVRVEGKVLVYRYDHLDFTSDEVDRRRAQASIEPMLQKSTCADPKSRELMAEHVRISHRVIGMDSLLIGLYDVTEEVCEGLEGRAAPSTKRGG